MSKKGFYGISANGLLLLAVQLPKDLRKLLGLVLGCILEPWALSTALTRLRS